MEQLLRDIRYSIRSYRSNPGFLIVVILVLGLGVGLNTAIFSVVHGILIQSLPYQESQNLVTVWGKIPTHGLNQLEVSVPEYMDYRSKNKVFESIAAYGTTSFNLTGTGEPERLVGTWTSASLFEVLRVRPVLGRVFTVSEDRPGHDGVVVLSFHVWKRRFASDERIIGKTLFVNSQPNVVIGVMPESFAFPDQFTDVWFPVAFDAEQLSENERGSHWLGVIARTHPGVSINKVQSDMHLLAKQLQAEHPAFYEKDSGWDVYAIPLKDLVTGEVRPALIVLFGAVGFVLLIACANISNLLIARAISREAEIAIRTALGASSRRLTLQLFTESFMLSVLGGCFGLLFAFWAVDLLVSFGPENLPRIQEIHLNGIAVLFAFIIAVLTGLLFGVAPVLQARAMNLRNAMGEGERSFESKKQNRLRNLLVVLEVSLSLVLLIGAGLFIRSLYRLQQVNPGFRTENVVSMRLSLPTAIYPEPAQQRMFFQRLMERVEGISQIHSAGLINYLPLSGLGNQRDFSIKERGHMLLNVEFRMASPRYFQTMGIPILQGRDFLSDDREQKPYVAIVNQRFVRIFFSNQAPIGKQIKLGSVDGPFPWLTIVGVVGDVKHESLDLETKPELYIPYTQPPLPDFRATSFSIVARVQGDSKSASVTLRNAVWSLDKNLPVYQMTSMKEMLDRSLDPRRFQMTLLILFALIALILAIVGIYGLMSYTVLQRSQEIGLRMAFGASARDVLKLFLKRALVLSVFGVGAGLAAAFALSRFLSGLLYGISSTDTETFFCVSFLLVLVALFATAIPAIRASRLDASSALRHS